MKIRLGHLKQLIREAYADTTPAQLDPKEQEMAKELPTWGKTPHDQVPKQASPAGVKAKQVANILSKKGLTNTPANKKKITQGLLPYIEKMDPQDIFVADPDELAQQFAQEVLGAVGD